MKAEELDILDQQKRYREFRKNEILFQKDQYPRDVYCIRKGRVKTIQTGTQGKDQIMSMFQTGDLLGYSSLFSDEYYGSTAMAMESTLVCLFPRDLFLSLVRSSPGLNCRLITQMSRDLRQGESRILQMSQESARKRLINSLLYLQELYGCERDSKTLKTRITREELANLSGMTRETSIRILQELARNHWIQLSGKKIGILRLDWLKKESMAL